MITENPLNDFGFTIETEITNLIDHDTKDNNELVIQDLKSRLIALQAIFLPLLERLASNPDKEMIKWPNRKEVIEEQIEKLKYLTTI